MVACLECVDYNRSIHEASPRSLTQQGWMRRLVRVDRHPSRGLRQAAILRDLGDNQGLSSSHGCLPCRRLCVGGLRHYVDSGLLGGRIAALAAGLLLLGGRAALAAVAVLLARPAGLPALLGRVRIVGDLRGALLRHAFVLEGLVLLLVLDVG